MSSAQTSARIEGQRWLKTLNGTVYGPSDTFTLCLWAADARITPGCLVSDNGADWRQAESVPELRMQWLVDMPEGATYGPLNLLSLWELMREESVRRGTRISHAVTGKSATLDDSLMPLLMEEWRELLTGAGQVARESAAGLRSGIRSGEAASKTLAASVEMLERKLLTAEKDLAVSMKLVAETQKFLAGRDETVRTLEDRLRDAEARAARAETEWQRAAAELKAAGADRRVDEANAKIASLERAMTDAALGYEAKLRSERASGDAFRTALETARARIAELEANTNGVERAYGARLEEARAAWREAEDRAEAANARIGEIERRASETVRELTARLSEAQSACREAERGASDAARRLEAMRGEAHSASQERDEAKREAAAAAARLQERGEELRRTQESLKATAEQKDLIARRAQEELAAAQSECGALRAAIETERKTGQLREKELSDERARLSAEAAHLQGVLEEATAALKEAEEERRRRDERDATLTEAVEREKARADEGEARFKRELDEVSKRATDMESRAARLQSELEAARSSSTESERRLRDELANVRRELNAMLMLRTAITRANDETSGAGEAGQIDWLGLGSSSAGGPPKAGIDGRPIAEQVAALQDEIRAAVTARTRIKKENELLQREATERQAAFLAREDALKSRIRRMQEEEKTSAAMNRKALEEVEKREGLLRTVRKKAEERERELLDRIAELEQGAQSEPVDGDGEWEHPGPKAGTATDSAAGTPPHASIDVLSHVEAQLREELRKWDSRNAGGDSGRGKDKKWFWRK